MLLVRYPHLKTTLRIFLVLFFATLLYTIYDNHRFIVVEQGVVINDLPEAFEDFRILQISDLHGRKFGENQAELIQAINQIDYDMIAFTGDMNNSTAWPDSPQNSEAILTLLDGIVPKGPMFWVDGNTGPYAVETMDGVTTGRMTEMGRVLQEKGCTILLTPMPIQRGEATLWITPELSEVSYQGMFAMFDNQRWLERYGSPETVRSFLEDQYAFFRSINGNGDIKILLTHVPKQGNLSEAERQMMGELDYDLILAGHYHGGQFRLPLLGAIYIPSPTTGMNGSGLFPAQNAVKGLGCYGSVPQYVSAGLGASGHVGWLHFRLFNTPEINLIVLRRRGT